MILDSTPIDSFWVESSVNGYAWVVATYTDSELWQITAIERDMPITAQARIKSIVAGVTFDDYSLERWVDVSAFDETGQYDFCLLHPNEADHSPATLLNSIRATFS